ncbi:MAG: hypothetical protein ACRD4M_06960 [Candidatus Acidiferrales bacterium]
MPLTFRVSSKVSKTLFAALESTLFPGAAMDYDDPGYSSLESHPIRSESWRVRAQGTPP